MRSASWARITVRGVVALVLAILVAPGMPVRAQAEPPVDVHELAKQYAPVLYFHPDELFRPQSVDSFLASARLRQSRERWRDINVSSKVSPFALAAYQDVSYYLDVWLGDTGSSDYRNYSALRAYYQEALGSRASGHSVAAYAHVVTDEDSDHIIIQYWFFYFYNDWVNKHEGDWEMIQVMLDPNYQPEWAVYSQHKTGTRRHWRDVPVEDGTHPVVYVALGSHANYFCGDEQFAHTQVVGNSQVEAMDRTGRSGRVIPEVILLTEQPDQVQDLSSLAALAWLRFAGRWGEDAPISDFSGPVGPRFKGEQWDRPLDWGMAQPLDLETWYANRLRVVVKGTGADVLLTVNGNADLPAAETLAGTALLHQEVLDDDVVSAEIRISPRRRYDLIATWPDVAMSVVKRYVFKDVPPGTLGRARLVMQAGAAPLLLLEGSAGVLQPSNSEAEPVARDAPDFVWVAAGLPVLDVVRGVAVSLLASLLPALLYLGLLYYADRYEKEPKRLIAAAFFWGALPAILVALVAELFFQLPVDLLGREAIEALRIGLVAPLVEETLKAAVVLYIVHRYRHEIHSVHDGIIYGAAVGLGFAMTGNMLSYLGAFLLRGFPELQQKVFVEGFLYGLSHALYTAIFGAGLAYAVLARKRQHRWAVPLAAFLLAVTCNALHGLVVHSGIGVSPVRLAVTWMGGLIVLLVMLASLRRQGHIIQRELVGEVPDSLRLVLTRPGARAWAEGRALVGQGYQGWRRTRRIYQLSARLAFRKAQSIARPDEPGLEQEVQSLRGQLHELLEIEGKAGR